VNLAHLHLIINHVPTVGSVAALGLLLLGYARRNEHLKHVGLEVLFVIAVLTLPVYASGVAAHQELRPFKEVSDDAIKIHQDAALIGFTVMEFAGFVAWVALWKWRRHGLGSRGIVAAATVLLVLALAVMGRAANLGGDIRHPEILSGEASTTLSGAAGAKLIEVTQHFVIDSSMWVWPILEDFHFIGLILLFGSIGVLSLRIAGFFKQLPVAPLHRFIPWGIGGFAINVVTGFLFYLGMPGFYNMNFVFQLKIFTIFVAGVILLLFYCTSAFRTLERLGPGEDAPALAKFLAIASIVLWIAVIVLGRYIPFGEVT